VELEKENKIEIELLKKDVTTMSALLEKFDTTIDKMQEIASNLSKMLSLQEQRLETQEKVTTEFQGLMEMRRQEHNENIKDVYERINRVNEALTDKITTTEKTILTEIQKLREELHTNKDNLGSRIGQIEVWKYAIVGVGIIISWAIGQSNVISKIFSSN